MTFYHFLLLVDHNISVSPKARGIHPILANEREKLESRPDGEEVISKGCIWSGAKKTSQETAKNWIKNFVWDEVIWKTEGTVEILIEFDPLIGQTSSQISFALL